MTTEPINANIDKAARIVGKTMSRWDMDGRPDIPGGIDTHITEALAKAGLLMPDLPEPDDKCTNSDASWMLTGKAAVDSWRDEGGPVVALMAGRGRYLTPAEARQLAYILLAAAGHAEGEKPSPKSVDELPLLRPSTVEEENAIREKYGLPLIR